MSNTEITALKAELRRDFRAARRHLKPALRTDLDQRICDHLIRSPVLRKARCIAAYLAFDGEPDLGPAMAGWSEEGKRIALPVINSPRPGHMELRLWAPVQGLRKNTLGIGEPSSGLPVPAAELDVVLVPLVAFDRDGRRLGMGAGYFDRFLAPVCEQSRPRRVGVAYGLQEAGNLPEEPWDISLHAVVTEGGWFTCPG